MQPQENRVTLGDACKRALHVATNARRLELVRCHSQYNERFMNAMRDALATRQVQIIPLWLVLLLF